MQRRGAVLVPLIDIHHAILDERPQLCQIVIGRRQMRGKCQRLGLLGEVSLPLDMRDILDDVLLEESLGEHLHRLAVIVAGCDNTGDRGALRHEILDDEQVSLHCRQVSCTHTHMITSCTNTDPPTWRVAVIVDVIATQAPTQQKLQTSQSTVKRGRVHRCPALIVHGFGLLWKQISIGCCCRPIKFD